MKNLLERTIKVYSGENLYLYIDKNRFQHENEFKAAMDILLTISKQGYWFGFLTSCVANEFKKAGFYTEPKKPKFYISCFTPEEND